MEEVVEHEQEVLLAKVGDEFPDVRAEALDFAVLRLVQAVNPEVNGVVEFRKSGAHFFAGDEIRGVTQTVKHFETAIEGIVVGYGHQIHPPALRRRVDIEGPGIAIPAAQEAEMLGAP
jgi:hypothetical protein